MERQLRISQSHMEKLPVYGSQISKKTKRTRHDKALQKQLAEQLVVHWGNYHCLHSLHSVCAVLGPAAATVQAMAAHARNPYALQSLCHTNEPLAMVTTQQLRAAQGAGQLLLNTYLDALQRGTRWLDELSGRLQSFKVGLSSKHQAAASQMEAQTARDYRKDTVLHVKAARTWMAVAAGLPEVEGSGISVPQVLVSYAVDWQSMVTVSSGFKMYLIQDYEDLRSLIYDVLGRHDLCHAMMSSSRLPPSLWGQLLQSYNITAQGLQAVGMPPQQIELLMGWQQEAAAARPRTEQCSSQHDQCSAGSMGRSVGEQECGSRVSTGSSSSMPSAQSGEVGDLGDMQSLLDMMYGASVAKELQATCAANNGTLGSADDVAPMA